jgi:hypothetical protein
MAELLPGEPRRGGFMRVLGGGRSPVAAYIAGIVGAAAFVASLVVDWLHMTLPQQEFIRVSAANEVTVGLSGASYSVAYIVGMLGLLALLGAVLGRPELAARLRLSAVGLGVGMAGVLVGISMQMRDVISRLFGFTVGYPDDLQSDIRQIVDDTTYAALPGQFLSVGAVVALVAGVWLAAGPVRGGAAAGSGVVATEAGGPIPSDELSVAAEPVSPSPVGPPGLPLDRPGGGPGWPPSRVGYADGLTVTSSDATDPGTQADVLDR